MPSRLSVTQIIHQPFSRSDWDDGWMTRITPKAHEPGTLFSGASAGGQVLHSYISLPMSYRSTVFMLPAVWRRVEGHRHHRRACGDSQDPHASGLACARAAALTGAARASRDAVTLRRTQPSRVDAEPEESREWGIFTKHRTIDRLLGRRYIRGQSKEAFKFFIRPTTG